LYSRGTLIAAGLFASSVLTNDSIAAPSKPLPSEQQVLTFIADTIDWYRHLPTAQRIGTEPADLLFLEDNRPIATEIVRRSFDFGKALAGIDPPQNSLDHPESAPGDPAANSELQYLIAAEAKLDANTQQAVEQLRSVTQARLTAHGADRQKLEIQMAEIRSRIQLLKAMSANYGDLLDFVRTASADPHRATSLGAMVENLERTVPDVSSTSTPSPGLNIPADPPRAPYGIMGMISQVTGLTRKEGKFAGRLSERMC